MSDSEDDIPLALRVAPNDNGASGGSPDIPEIPLKSEGDVVVQTSVDNQGVNDNIAKTGFVNQTQTKSDSLADPNSTSASPQMKIPKKPTSKPLPEPDSVNPNGAAKTQVKKEPVATTKAVDNKPINKPVPVAKSDSGISGKQDNAKVEDVKPVIPKKTAPSTVADNGKSKPSAPSKSQPSADVSNKQPPKAEVKRSRDDIPLSKLAPAPKKVKSEAPSNSKPKKVVVSSDDDSSDSESLSSDSDDSDSSNDDEPLSKRIKTPQKAAPKKKTPSKTPSSSSSKVKPQPRKTESKRMWETLEHQGVIFPPDYVPHGVKMLYDGKPVDLSPPEEEVASMFAAMKDTDYAAKPVFCKNFWNDFVATLTPENKKIIKHMDRCDFTPIYVYLNQVREEKKNMSKEEKVRIKEERAAQEAPFLYAIIDGRREKVGNFRVEPPGLFRGRGEHPKMGKLKRRIYPEDIIINIGEGAPVPDTRYPGHSWGEVRHSHEVTWLAGWKDSINTQDWKYVQFAAQSSIKGDSDLKKYEKARKLKDYIEKIRADYTRGMKSSDQRIAQMSVAVYLIDKLALRAGGEKDEDLADTVGCCTLRVGHVILQPPSSIKLDFLGKDSIRYEQTHEVLPQVYQAIQEMCQGKKDDQDLFDLINPQLVNEHLQTLMEGLTIKVFRTYNASIVLDNLLAETVEGTVPQKKAQYDSANKDVAVLCNHQKGVSKSHDNAMAKLRDKKEAMEKELKDLKKAKKDGNDKKIAALKERIAKLDIQMNTKEELKTVSLGTSKTNYLDPRISIAWCKKWEVPLTVVFTRALIDKFNWAVEVEPDFRF